MEDVFFSLSFCCDGIKQRGGVEGGIPIPARENNSSLLLHQEGFNIDFSQGSLKVPGNVQAFEKFTNGQGNLLTSRDLKPRTYTIHPRPPIPLPPLPET
jgi:hypothetical protein